jgi:hypothetical protein
MRNFGRQLRRLGAEGLRLWVEEARPDLAYPVATLRAVTHGTGQSSVGTRPWRALEMRENYLNFERAVVYIASIGCAE